MAFLVLLGLDLQIQLYWCFGPIVFNLDFNPAVNVSALNFQSKGTLQAWILIPAWA